MPTVNATITLNINGVPVSFTGAIPVPATGMSGIQGTLPAGQVGVPYAAMLAVLNGLAPFTWQIAGLPKGLAYAQGTPGTLLISGTPTQSGSFGLTVGCEDLSTPARQVTSVTQFVTIAAAVVTPLPPPPPSGDAPTNVSAIAWPNGALLSFTAGAAPAGKSIVSFTATGAGGATWLTDTAPASPMLVQGGDSASNNFTVHANYSDGTVSVESVASNKVTPTLPANTPSTSPNVYVGGIFYWGGDYSYGAGLEVIYADTTETPPDGAPYCVSLVYTNSGGWQPFAPNNAYDLTPYTKISFWWKSNVANDPLVLRTELVGDKPTGTPVTINDSTYGPTPQAGVWGFYTVPLAAMGIGVPAGVPTLYKLQFTNPNGSFARKESFAAVMFS